MAEKAMKNIVIIAGGDSSEYEVSLRSAAGLYSFMDKSRYKVFVACLHGHTWQLALDYAEGKDFKESVENDPDITKYLTKEEIDDCFDYKFFIRRVDMIFDRFGL